jgi:hypothetical protein
MGLAEKRAISELSNKFGEWKERIQKASGGLPLELEVVWDTLTVEDIGMYPKWELVFMTPMEKTLQSICRDNFGKEALQNKIKKIVFQNTKDNSFSTEGFSISGDTIYIDHNLGNADYPDDRADHWIKSLENVL